MSKAAEWHREIRSKVIRLHPFKAPPRTGGDEWRHERIRRGWAVLEHGGNISAFACTEGISPPSALQWLRHHQPDLLEELKFANHCFPREKRLERLIYIRDARARGMKEKDIAKGLNIDRANVHKWVQKWAPDGIEAAIEDETEYCEETDNACYSGEAVA